MAAGTTLDQSDFLVSGERYTITVNEPTLATGTSIDTILAELQGIPTMSHISLSRVGWNFDVTFTYTGDGSDVVANLFAQIVDRLDTWYGTWNYVAAYHGGTGAATGTKITPSIPALSTSGLWAIAIIAIVLVFVLSGGIGLARGVTKAVA
jgi:hypothetical protein